MKGLLDQKRACADDRKVMRERGGALFNLPFALDVFHNGDLGLAV